MNLHDQTALRKTCSTDADVSPQQRIRLKSINNINDDDDDDDEIAYFTMC